MGLYEKLRQRQAQQPDRPKKRGGLLQLSLRRKAELLPDGASFPSVEAGSPGTRVSIPPAQATVPEILRRQVPATPAPEKVGDESQTALKSSAVAAAAGDLPDLEEGADHLELVPDQQESAELNMAEIEAVAEELEELEEPAEVETHPEPKPTGDQRLDVLAARIARLRDGVESPVYLFQLLVNEFRPSRAVLLLYDSWTRALVPAGAHGWEPETGFTVSPSVARTELTRKEPLLRKGDDLAYLDGMFSDDEEIVVKSFTSEGMANGMMLFGGVESSRLLQRILALDDTRRVIDEAARIAAALGTVQLDYMSGDTVAAGESELIQISCRTLLEAMLAENPTITRNWMRQMLLRIMGSLLQSIGKVAVFEGCTLKLLTQRVIDHELLAHQTREMLNDLLKVTSVARDPEIVSA